ncbi:MAG: FAD-dependent monooxygenase, partial [Pseudolabrys sp.]
MRTQVGIVGAGPAGLMLGHLLHLAGIESIIIESRSRAYCENRIRAGLIEQWVIDLLTDTGVGERMKREAMFHGGINLNFSGSLHRLDFRALVGR